MDCDVCQNDHHMNVVFIKAGREHDTGPKWDWIKYKKILILRQWRFELVLRLK